MRPTPARTILLFLVLPLGAIAAQAPSTTANPEYSVDAPSDLNSAGLRGGLLGTVRLSDRGAPGSPGSESFWLEGDGAVQMHPETGVLFRSVLALPCNRRRGYAVTLLAGTTPNDRGRAANVLDRLPATPGFCCVGAAPGQGAGASRCRTRSLGTAATADMESSRDQL